MKNSRIACLEESLRKEQESVIIVLGSVSYENNTMILCVKEGFSGTIVEGERYIQDHPENQYFIFDDQL